MSKVHSSTVLKISTEPISNMHSSIMLKTNTSFMSKEPSLTVLTIHR